MPAGSNPSDIAVDVTYDGGKTNVAVTDRASGRAWTGSGATTGEAATEATRKFLGDRRAAEYLKRE